MTDEAKTKEQLVSELNEMRLQIADLKSSEEKFKQLKEEQEKFAKAFLENSTPMSITTLKEGRFVDVSEAFLELMGLEKHEIIGNTSIGLGFMTGEQRTLLLNELKEKGRVANLELQVKTKRGEARYVLINSSMISIGGENFLLSVFTDITNRRNAEEALLLSDKRFRTIYENTTLGIFETTPAGKIIHTNQTFAVMFGFDSPQQAICEIHDLARQLYVNPDHRAEMINKVLGSTTPLRFETEYRRKDGSTFMAILEIQAVRDKETGKIKFFGFVEDITQRKLAEEGQRIAEELYRTLAERSFAGVYVVQNGKFRFINSKAALYAGYSKEELISQPSKELIHPEDRETAEKNAMEMLRGKRDIPYEFRIMTKRGETRWIMETVTSINYSGKQAILGNSMDITEYKMIEKERERLIAELQKALLEVKKLSGLLPICSSCKKIRNDEGYWEQLEGYIRDRSEAEFSHSICPDCVKKLYPDLFKNK
jgi:PAS domain S-box-containing protein